MSDLIRLACLIEQREAVAPTYQQPTLADDMEDIGVAIFDGTSPEQYQLSKKQEN